MFFMFFSDGFTMQVNLDQFLCSEKKMLLMQLNLGGCNSVISVPTATFFGKNLRKVTCRAISPNIPSRKFKVVSEVDEGKQTGKDRWKGLVYDVSDDQQDITRGKGMVDTLFQAPMGTGTHDAVLSSYEYISQGLRQ